MAARRPYTPRFSRSRLQYRLQVLIAVEERDRSVSISEKYEEGLPHMLFIMTTCSYGK